MRSAPKIPMKKCLVESTKQLGVFVASELAGGTVAALAYGTVNGSE